MKKITLLASFILIFSGLQAQTEQGQSVVCLNAGYSIIGNGLSAAVNELADDNAQLSTTPVIIGSFDYGVTDKFSMGLFFGYQSTKSDFTYTYFDQGDSTTENVTVSGTRTNISIRPNFHYLSSDKLDLYSGLRVGWLFRNFSQNSTDENFETLDIFDGNRFTMGLTLLGARYYFTDNIGINMEVGIGVPYAVNGGLSVRF
ncbi:porin family protein [bacterium]|nr:porin family protein [bacterium]